MKFYGSLIYLNFLLQDTGGIADRIAKLCRTLPQPDELKQFWEKIYIAECEDELKKLYPQEDNDNIEEYVKALNDMKELIVVFDAIERRINFLDAIADAMLKGLKYRVEKYEKFFSPDTRSGELEWCLVRFHSSK